MNKDPKELISEEQRIVDDLIAQLQGEIKCYSYVCATWSAKCSKRTFDLH